MRVRRVICIVLVFPLLISAFGGAEIFPPDSPQAVEQRLDGGLIVVADSLDEQYNPAVAYNGKAQHYLIVYEVFENQGDIRAQFINAKDGKKYGGWWEVANTSAEERNPDVVYDPVHARFLVVWESYHCVSVYCYYVIKGRLLYGKNQMGGNLAGYEFLIASEHEANLYGRDLLGPAVAYNADDEQYAVVYLIGDSNSNDRWTINGQLLSAGPSNPNVLTDVYDGFEIEPISYTLQPNHPDVAWSSQGNSFLVVYEEQFPTHVDQIAGHYLYDTYQGGGTQVRGTGGSIIAPIFEMDNTPDVDEYNHPFVAYDPLSGYYLASIEHSQSSGSSTSTRIYGYRIEGAFTGEPGTVGYPIPIETQIDNKFISHDSPHAAYSGADGEVYVTYRTDYEENGKSYYHIYNRTVRGKSVQPRLKIQSSFANEFLSGPDAAGTEDGRALVVWHNQLFDEPYTMEVFGQRLKPLLKLYIPIVLEK